MPVPSSITDLSQTPGSNSPAGSESPALLDDYLRTAFAFIAQLRDGVVSAPPVDLASAATTDIGAQNSPFIRITGTTTITSFGTNYVGPKFINFGGALTLTHNATSLILPGGVSITTAAGDTCIAVPNLATPTGWRILTYQRASGSGEEVSTVKTFARKTAPVGWLKANGQTIGSASSGATARANDDTLALYTILWDDWAQADLPIQTSTGSASTRGASAAADFAANKRLPLPNLCGEFVRGWDDGRGVDSGRAFGSAQSSQNLSHNHTGITTTDGSHTHGTGGDGVSVVAGGQGVRYWGDGAQQTGFSGSHNHTLSINNSGGTEARPRSIALLYCIKY